MLPLIFSPPDGITGASWCEVEPFYRGDRLRQIERASIRIFMERHCGLLKGRVLDFGSGKPGTCLFPRPYQDLVEGEYVPVDEGDPFPAGPYDAIMCNQVIQYFPEPARLLDMFHALLLDGKVLVMTYPTAWPETSDPEKWRFTKAGMKRMLERAGFAIVEHEKRAEVMVGQSRFSLGYGVVCTRV